MEGLDNSALQRDEYCGVFSVSNVSIGFFWDIFVIKVNIGDFIEFGDRLMVFIRGKQHNGKFDEANKQR